MSPKSAFFTLLGSTALAAICLFSLGERSTVEGAPRTAGASAPVHATAAPPAPTVERAPKIAEAASAAARGSPTELLDLARPLATSDPRAARNLLRSALDIDDDHEQALESLAAKMLADENVEEARKLVKRCLTVNPRNAICRKLDLFAPPATPVLAKGSAMLRRCLRFNPEQLGCLYGSFHLALLNGNPAEAKTFLQTLLSKGPDSATALMAQGRMKASSGDYAGAYELFELACSKDNEEACFRAGMLEKEGWK